MDQPRRFFVSVEIPDRRTAARIFEHGFDFYEQGHEAMSFMATEAGTEAGTAASGKRSAVTRLGGLLTLEQIGELVRSGIPVLVREDATPHLSQPVPSAEFEDWLEDFERSFPTPKGARPLALSDAPTRGPQQASSRRRGRKKT